MGFVVKHVSRCSCCRVQKSRWLIIKCFIKAVCVVWCHAWWPSTCQQVSCFMSSGTCHDWLLPGCPNSMTDFFLGVPTPWLTSSWVSQFHVLLGVPAPWLTASFTVHTLVLTPTDWLGALNTMCVSACMCVLGGGWGRERTWSKECTAKLSSNDLGSNLGTTDCLFVFAEVKLLILTEDLKRGVWLDRWSSLRSRRPQKTQRVVWLDEWKHQRVVWLDGLSQRSRQNCKNLKGWSG